MESEITAEWFRRCQELDKDQSAFFEEHREVYGVYCTLLYRLMQLASQKGIPYEMVLSGEDRMIPLYSGMAIVKNVESGLLFVALGSLGKIQFTVIS